MISGYQRVLTLLCLCASAGARDGALLPVERAADDCLPQADVSAVAALIKRVLGPSGGGDAFDLCMVALPADGKDVFGIRDGQRDGHIVLSGATIGSLASAFNWYLKYSASAQVSWAGDQLQLPRPLSKVKDGPVQMVRPVPRVYYANVCTMSYTMAWWNWPRWERELDWMAMNGINLPLAFVGQEWIWRQTFAHFGLTSQDMDSFFSGPAFLAWQRMGNIRGWGGPLPDNWFKMRRALQHKILGRMQLLGMTPVLPCFAGHVPAELTKAFPAMNVSRSQDWGGMPQKYGEVYTVEPADPMFDSIGRVFMKEQLKEYGQYLGGQGSAHFYNCDQYNEMDPPSSDPAYLRAASRAVWSYMSAADSSAVWLMQGWLFVDPPAEQQFWVPNTTRAYLSGVPDDKLVVLDLFAEVVPVWNKTENFYGKPYVWSMLHNYGGNLGLYGMMQHVATAPELARAAPNSTQVGLGLSMEGTQQNYAVYDLMLENAWRPLTAGPAGRGVAQTQRSPDLVSWVHQYAERRYGLLVPAHAAARGAMVGAWEGLLATVYSANASTSTTTAAGAPQFWGVTKSLVVLRPALNMTSSGFMPTQLFYPPRQLVQAWKQLIDMSTGSRLIAEETYRYDVVDVTRQVLSNLFLERHARHSKAFRDGDTGALDSAAHDLRQILRDMEEVLGADKHFLLGNWLADAREWGGDDRASQNFYEHNARLQITQWGPSTALELSDYASKTWSGLVADYYTPRWDLYLRAVGDALAAGTGFNATQFGANVTQLELVWLHAAGSSEYPRTPQGNPILIANKIRERHFP